MEIRRISCGRFRPDTSSNTRRFATVELLVKVIAAGQFSLEEKSWRMAAMDSVGTMVR